MEPRANAPKHARPRPRTGSGAHPHPSGPHHCYLYAIGRHGPELTAATTDAPGLDGAPAYTVTADGLEALVCDVPADAFSEAGLRGQLEDLERLADIARAHHALVAAASALATVLPMRLGTVYRDAARVAQVLQENGAALRTLLDRLEGHAEWGVKVYLDAGATGRPAHTPAPGTNPDTHESQAPGRAYLRRRRAARDAQRTAHRAAGEVAAQVRARASELAADRVAHRPQQGELAAAGENLVNDAYLVAAEHTAAFQAAVQHAADGVPGVRVEVTGPWAPYSFAAAPPPPQARSATAEQAVRTEGTARPQGAAGRGAPQSAPRRSGAGGGSGPEVGGAAHGR